MTFKTQIEETSASDVKRRFDDIFLDNWQQVHRFLSHLIGDPSEAEDIALEAFLRLYQITESNDRELNIGGWLYRAASNLGLNAIRSRKRRQQYELTSGMQVIVENSDASPAEIFAVEESRQRVRQILGEMNPRQAQLLILRYSGTAYQEIALILGVSPTSVGPLLTRAESEFEKRFRSIYPEGG